MKKKSNSKKKIIKSEIPEEILAQPGNTEKHLSETKNSIQSLHYERYEGIFPPPMFLKGYEEVLPGAADRIFALTENNAKNRIEINNKKLKIESRNSLLGLIFGFTITLAFLAASVYLIAGGKQIAGTIIGTLDLVSLVSVFVIGTKKKKEMVKKLIKNEGKANNKK